MDEATPTTPAQDQMQAASVAPDQPTTPVQSATPETAQTTTQDVVTDQQPAPIADPAATPATIAAAADVPWAAPAVDQAPPVADVEPAASIPAAMGADGNAIHTPAPGQPVVTAPPLVGGEFATQETTAPPPAPTDTTLDPSAPSSTAPVAPAPVPAPALGDHAPVVTEVEAAQNPATNSQPPSATVVATPDAAVPSQVVQVEQPATIPDSDPNAAEGAVVPNPNLVTNQTQDIPAPINPTAIGPTPAPITHEEAVAHIAQQQAAADAANAVVTPTAPVTHKDILDSLMADLEGLANMGKQEIRALIEMARARYAELEGKSTTPPTDSTS